MPTHDRPNMIVILTDDQGYGDLSCMGSSDVVTPHLDRLAAQGVRFTSCYSNSPVCSPARASLLTGRYPAHAGVRSILSGHRQATGLPQSTPTLAGALAPLGYRTGMVGKWHLGVDEPHRPHHHGFDEWYGFLAGCIDFYSHIFYWGQGGGINPVHDLWDNNREVWDNGRYFTEMITERAVDFIERSAQGGAPFLLYVGYNAPHYPMHAPKEYMDRFAHLPWDRQVMAAMLAAVDDGVGEMARALDRHGLAENTCIVFMSDNGPSRESRNWLDGTPDPYYGGSAGALKGHKFSLYEGGIRVPGLLCWPKVVPAGQTLHDPVAAMDVLPTLLLAAGGSLDGLSLDGIDLLPWLTGASPLPDRSIFWEMNQQTAVRQGPWKLVLNGQLVEHEEPPVPVHLANLDDDMGERRNLIHDHPDIAKDLQAAAEAWRAGIEAHWAQCQAGGYTGHP